MRLRYTLSTLLAVLVASFGIVSAQHGTDTGTPHAGDHADQGDSGHQQMEGISMGAFYFTITNNGEETDRLVMIETEMAHVVEIHDVEIEDGVMKMVPMHDGLEIEPGETITFEPGGYHVMLIGITESMLDGEDFQATLHFEHAGELEITVSIYALEPDEGEHGDAVEIGDIEVSNIWARQAPKLDGQATPVATPGATPHATPDA